MSRLPQERRLVTEIMDAAHSGGLGGTYGGNPVACAAALGGIETMKELDLPARASRIGEVLTARLTALAAKHDVIGEVHGPWRGDRGGAGEARYAGRVEGAGPGADGRVGEGVPRGGPGGADVRHVRQRLRFPPPLVVGGNLLNEGLDVIEGAFAGLAS